MQLLSVGWRFILSVLAALALLGLDVWQRASAPGTAVATWPLYQPVQLQALGASSTARGLIPMPEGARAAHASSLLPMPAGHPAALTLFWFSGERESGPLVQIVASQWLRSTGQWTLPRAVVNRHHVAAQLGYGVRRLGNPVAWLDGQGRVHLFVVATGWGGWAAARILHLRQSSIGNRLDELAFEPVQVLPLSWLWNTSYLVRNAPLPLADGGMVLPVHFELGIKYPAALRFDRNGVFRGMVRISSRSYLLQPSLLPLDTDVWLALMRNEQHGGKIGVAQTTDGGLHWDDLPDLALDNPDSAVATLALAPGQLLLAHNSSVGSRGTLDVSQSNDGRNWTLLNRLEHGTADDEFSYPALTWTDDQLWLSYTVDRKYLAWQGFTVPAPIQERAP
ncbi:MAG: exo-alpha-sialidase [Rhodoferax sp.]|nr:exo-alpha-sialidase [Rhodoferax sp.]